MFTRENSAVLLGLGLIVALFALLGAFLQSTYDAERSIVAFSSRFQAYLEAPLKPDSELATTQRVELAASGVWNALITLKYLTAGQLEAWKQAGEGGTNLSLRLAGFLERQRQIYAVLQQLLFLSVAATVLIAAFLAVLNTRRRETEALLRQLHQQQLSQGEEERKALSRDLHDAVMQDLAAAKITLSQTSVETDAKRRILASLDSAIEHVRQVAWGLRPSSLDSLGLFGSLSELCQSVSYRAQVPIRLLGTPFVERLDSGVAVNVYRIVQEGLTNALRHGQPRSIGVEVTRTDDKLVVTVAGDGQSQPSKAVKAQGSGGLGLVGMRERALMIGASLEVEFPASGGTRLKVTVPL